MRTSDPPSSTAHNNKGTVVAAFLFNIFVLWCVFAEELFSLVPDELGCLEDKDKPEAKVCVCMVNVGAVSMGLF